MSADTVTAATATVETRADAGPSAETASGIETRSRSRVLPLDGLRAIAIVLVLLYHLHVPNFTGGFMGVNIFFVLSGYLITSILLRERRSAGRIDLPRFWLRRLLRLYPALLVLVVAAVCLWFLVGDYSGANVGVWGSALHALTYTSNLGRWLSHHSIGVLAQTWSLGMEEQFYLVWPPLLVLLFWLRARKAAVLSSLVGLVLASAVATWVLYEPRAGGATPDIYFSPVLNISPLLTGAILAILLTNERVRTVLAGALGEWFTWIGLAALVAIDLSIRPGWQDSRAVFGVVLPLSGIATGLLLAGLVSRRTVVSRVLSLRPLSWFGRNISYSLYLWHVLVIALVRPLIPGDLGKVAAFAAAIVVATASCYAIERPFLKLKGRFEPRAKRVAGPDVAVEMPPETAVVESRP